MALLALLTLLNEPGAVGIPYVQGFEGTREALVAEGWRLPETCTLDRAAPRVGEQCLRVAVPEGVDRYAELFIPVEAGKFYRGQVWVKCESVERHPAAGQNRGAVIFLQWADQGKAWVGGGTFPTGLQGSQDWALVTVPYTRQIPPEVAYIHLLLGVEGAGTASFDDLQIEEMTEWEGVMPLEPEDGATVDLRRPLLKWEPKETRLRGVEIALSRSRGFPPDTTLLVQAQAASCRPPAALAPGTWYWRLQALSGAGKLPPGAVRSFVVAHDAALWPPDITPTWQWSDEPRPTLSASIRPPEAATQVRVTIDGTDAEVVSRQGDAVTFRPRGDLPAGVHEVVIAANGNGRSEELTGIFCNKQPGSRVTVRDDKVLLVDGEPFFPVGAYRDPSDTLTDFSGLTDAGFSLTHSYLFEDQKEEAPEIAREYLQRAHRNGLKVFMGLHRGRVFAQDRLWLQRWAGELMDEPALLTWYMMDEPAAQGLSVHGAQQIGAWLRQVDPFHPRSLVLCRPDASAQYAPACDILWNDPYPLPSRPITMVEDWAQRALAVTRPDQPYWIVLQGHDLRYWSGLKAALQQFGPITRPTPDETRCMAHMALAAGANGIIWYWGPNGQYHMQRDAPLVWQGICDTVHELRELTPFLVARRTPQDELTVPEPLRAWSREVDGTHVLALVNVSEGETEAQIDLAQFGVTALRSRDEDTEVRLDGSKLRTRFRAYEVKVYEWQDAH